MDNIRNISRKAGKFGAGVLAMAATGAAMAQTSGGSTTPDFSTPVVTTLTAGDGQIGLIGAAVVTLCALVALLFYVRRATK